MLSGGLQKALRNLTGGSQEALRRLSGGSKRGSQEARKRLSGSSLGYHLNCCIPEELPEDRPEGLAKQ